MSNIVIPPKINVGFQNRKDTYTGKLAYVIYFDDKGKLHKEPSWNGWRDEKIPNEIYENKPLEGFVLNKKVGGYKSHWDFRQTYARVYDPRGFEFEITVENLLWILENNDCIKGKGLVGEYVYGWDGKDLVLVPTAAPDYQEIARKNEIRRNMDFIKPKDLIIGATYKTIRDELYVYLGRYHYYKTDYTMHGEAAKEDGYTVVSDSVRGFQKINCDDVSCYYAYKDMGLYYYFASINKSGSLCFHSYNYGNSHFKSISGKFVECIDSTCHPKYKEFLKTEIENKDFFSPIDVSKNVIKPLTLKEFSDRMEHWLIKSGYRTYYCSSTLCYLSADKHYLKYADICYNNRSEKWQVRTNLYYLDYQSLEAIYETFKPHYGVQYLLNGREFRKVGI